MVLNIGILLNKSSTICKNFFPKKDRDKPPTIVIKKIVKIISIPGIEYGRYVFGFKPDGTSLVERLIKNLLKYRVKPIGINTITPVKK